MVLKGKIAIIVAGIALMPAAMCFAEVQTDVSGKHYRLDEQRQTAELTYLSYDSLNIDAYRGELEVPAEVQVDGAQYRVTGVTPFACVYCEGLTSVTLPEGMTRIGFGAFSDCPNLAAVSLPTSLTTLGDWAFYRDEALQEATVPEAVRRVGAATFAFCTSLAKVEIPRGVKSIAQHAFYYCTALNEVLIPGSVDQIGEYTFAYCTGLTKVQMEGFPIAITEDVFEGVDVSACTLVVPTDQVEAYKEAEVWRNFNIVDGGYEDLHEVFDDEKLPSYEMKVVGTTLYLNVIGDAPVLVYNLQGQRIAVAASHSGEHRIPLSHGQYIIKCGRESRKISL